MKYRISGAPPHIRRIRTSGRKTYSQVGDEINLTDAEYDHFTRMGVTLTPTDRRRKAPEVEPETEVSPIETGPMEPTAVPDNQ